MQAAVQRPSPTSLLLALFPGWRSRKLGCTSLRRGKDPELGLRGVPLSPLP